MAVGVDTTGTEVDTTGTGVDTTGTGADTTGTGVDTTGTGVDTTGTGGCSCEVAVGCVLPVVKHTHTDITETVYTCVLVHFHPGLGLPHSTEGYLSNGGYEHSRESVELPTDLLVKLTCHSMPGIVYLQIFKFTKLVRVKNTVPILIIVNVSRMGGYFFMSDWAQNGWAWLIVRIA